MLGRSTRLGNILDQGIRRQEIINLGYQGRVIYYPNPPTTALLFLPISGLGFWQARILWGTLSLLFMSLSILILLRNLQPSRQTTLLILAVALLNQPFKSDLSHGQVYSFLLLLLVLAWLSFRQNHQAGCGVACAGMALAKLFGAPIWLMLLIRGSWRALGIGLLVLCTVVIVSLPLLTLEAWQSFAYVPLRIRNDLTLMLTAFQSLQSFVRHLFTWHPVWNPHPLMDIPLFATILLWTLSGLIIGLTAYITLISYERDLIFAIFSCISVFFSPFAQDYTYILLLLPIIVLITHLHRSRASLYAYTITFIGIVLVITNLQFKSPALANGYRALLAYPKLYGALIIWAVLVWQTRVANNPSELSAERTGTA